MLGSLRGKVLEVCGRTALLEINGLGYEVELSARDVAVCAPGTETFVYVHQRITEDEQTLYGFTDVACRSLFKLLIDVHGVGPRLAMAILSAFDTAGFVAAVMQRDFMRLQQVPGVGRKTAERLTVELNDRLKNFAGAGTQTPPATGAADGGNFGETVAALTGLGYREAESVRVVREVTAPGMSTEALLVAALARLGGPAKHV